MMDQKSLRGVGERIITTFNAFAQPQASVGRAIGGRHIGLEAQRFQLWAHSLGLQRQGHASLDYRVRDSDIVRDRLLEVLLELEGHLGNLLSISNGERDPVEQGQASEGSISSSDSSSGSSYVEQDGDSDQDIFDEVAFRLKCLTERLDALYMIATRIRNPKNRPSRTNDQLYGNIAPADRESYRKEREEVETLTASYLHRQDLLGTLESQDELSSGTDLEELVSQYASAQNWVMQRTGIANARRKQQFVYWREHAAKLGGSQSQPPKTQQITPIPDAQVVQYERPHVLMSGYAGPSLATSATPLPANTIKPDDMKSVISHQSGFSVPIDAENELHWPAPPKLEGDDKYFQCPYCMILCPARYLNNGHWQKHLIHDLQPYHCTYEQCQDPHRLYGTRQEWIDHESQHLRVWHCRQHDEEFETQPDFVNHLELSHPEYIQGKLSEQVSTAAIAPSEHVHRDCPYCPSSFSGLLHMQKHILNHLERFAILAFPSLDDDTDGKQDLNSSNQSRDAPMRGRANSVLHDFPGIRELRCTGLFFKDASVQMSTIYYSIDDSVITCFARSNPADYAGFRIDYPLDIIKGLRFGYSGICLLLKRPPLFMLLSNSRDEFIPCADFTKYKRATSTLDHELMAQRQDLHHLKRQLEQLFPLADVGAFDTTKYSPFQDREDRNMYDQLDAPRLMLPDDATAHPYSVLKWCGDMEPHYEFGPFIANIRFGAETEHVDHNEYSERGDGDSDDGDSLNFRHMWKNPSRYTTAHEIYSVKVNTEFYCEEPPDIYIHERRTSGIDPCCAICHSLASVLCDCEAAALQAYVEDTEWKAMTPIYTGIRAWVQRHTRKAILERFRSRMGTKEIHSDVEAHTTNVPSHEELRSEWDDTCSQFQEIPEYLFSLVKASVPRDDDPAVLFPIRALGDG
ncbi:hypothetical protein PG990_003999 [Apiospora arundinis]